MAPVPSWREEEGVGMDWYAWLSRVLEPTYEYGLLFAHNELDHDDIPHFDHDFLLSMGISVGKHRLHILRLANKERSHRRHPAPVARLLTAAGRTRRWLARWLRSLQATGGSAGRDPSALVAAQRNMFGGGEWRSAVMKRERKLALLNQGRLMLTDAGVRVSGPLTPPPARSRSVSPIVYRPRSNGTDDSDEDKFRGGAAGEVEGIRWDSMFQDLKPT